MVVTVCVCFVFFSEEQTGVRVCVRVSLPQQPHFGVRVLSTGEPRLLPRGVPALQVRTHPGGGGLSETGFFWGVMVGDLSEVRSRITKSGGMVLHVR